MDCFKETLKPAQKVVEDSGLTKTDIDEIVLVRPSTRIPKIQQRFKKFFNGKEPSKGINPDKGNLGEQVPEIFRDLVPEHGKYPFRDLVPEIWGT